MKKTLLLFLIFVLLAGGVYFFRFRGAPPSQDILPKSEKVANEQIEEKKIGLPVSISIPSLGVSANIEHVGLDDERDMDVPKDAANVGWYNLGPKPGELGSAVMAGHLDDPSGAPAVFWDIKKMPLGEEIEVTDENGEKYTFIVKAIENYPWDDFPLQEVFADATGKKLNLITCDGTFDRSSRNYSERTVVYAQMVE